MRMHWSHSKSRKSGFSEKVGQIEFRVRPYPPFLNAEHTKDKNSLVVSNSTNPSVMVL